VWWWMQKITHKEMLGLSGDKHCSELLGNLEAVGCTHYSDGGIMYMGVKVRNAETN